MPADRIPGLDRCFRYYSQPLNPYRAEIRKQTAENLRIRADLMIELRVIIKRKGLTQAQSAKSFRVSQPRISALVMRVVSRRARAGAATDTTPSSSTTRAGFM